MKELITMWKNTRMIVLVAVTAALYAAILIPFKVAIPLVPGFTEVRPANVIPILCSLMFGPAAAWGAAIGNTIADAFGTFGLGTLFGFVGNFLYGYIPYKMWQTIGKGTPIVKSYISPMKSSIIALVSAIAVGLITWLITRAYMQNPQIYIVILSASIVFLVLRFLSIQYLLVLLTASSACGVFIGWGVHALGLVPFSVLANIITLNNFVVSAALGPLLIPPIYPVIKRLGLIYTDVMNESDLSKPKMLGSILMIIGVIGALIVGNWIAIGGYDMGVLGAGFGQAVQGAGGLGLGLAPFILLIIIAFIIM
ncbi:TPA: QueT transporter family protein [bacterium]|nr:QueT transporter family protein [bacterium]